MKSAVHKLTTSLLLPVTLGLMVFGLGGCGKGNKSFYAEYQPLIEAVYVSGEVAPQYEYKIYSAVEGVLLETYIQEGETVKKNQPLFLIDDETQQARLLYSSELYKVAKVNTGSNSPILSELESGMLNAKAKLREDSINYYRAKALWDQKSISKADLDKLQYAFEVSKNDYKARNNNYQKTKNQLNLELKNAESQFKINKFDEGNYLINSFTDGLMLEIYKKPGELIRRNDLIGLIGNTANTILKLSVDIQDIGKIKIGQDVVIKMDTNKDSLYDGKVTKIYPKVQSKDQTFLIEAVFTKLPPQVYYGSTVEANVIIQKKDKALVIPKKLVVENEYVWIKKNGKKEKIKIKKGIENYDWVEVLGGIEEKTKILTPQ
jgi:multidrug efflux pump subunit AcrA (membrane-fusion protein)